MYYLTISVKVMKTMEKSMKDNQKSEAAESLVNVQLSSGLNRSVSRERIQITAHENYITSKELLREKPTKGSTVIKDMNRIITKFHIIVE